jgi:hypothetical protein
MPHALPFSGIKVKKKKKKKKNIALSSYLKPVTEKS